jgi:hypothetical protein
MPVGVNVGYGINRDPSPNGFLFGGEASLVYFNRFRWIGGYADVIRDFGADQTRVSFGPEVGYGPFGLDAGFLAGDKGTGYVARATFSLVVFHLYGRFGHAVDREETFGELGLLVKYPTPLATWSDRPRRAEPPPPPLPRLPPPEEATPTEPSGPPSPEDAPTPSGPLVPDQPTQPLPRND